MSISSPEITSLLIDKWTVTSSTFDLDFYLVALSEQIPTVTIQEITINGKSNITKTSLFTLYESAMNLNLNNLVVNDSSTLSQLTILQQSGSVNDTMVLDGVTITDC